MSAAMAIAATAAVVATGYSIYSGERASKAQGEALDQQKQAQADAKSAAEKQQQTNEQAVNKANQKSPDVNSILDVAQKAAGGPSSTMLTGPMGVDPNALSLGKNTLLGG